MYEQEKPKSTGSIGSFLDKYFHITERNSNIKTEVLAGVTTFMTMAYIIILNPIILSGAGMDFKMVFVGTCVAAALTTLLMAVVAKYPFALASGMGLNSVLAYGVVKGMGLSWQVAMGIVVIEGFLITILVLTNLRELVMDAIPKSLKLSIGVAIGLFIAFIGFYDSKIMVANSTTILQFGNIASPMVIIAFLTLIIMTALMAFKVKGSILYGIIISTIVTLAICFGANMMGYSFNAYGIQGLPNTIEPLPEGMSNIPAGLTGNFFEVPTAESFGMFFQADILGALSLAFIPVIFAFMMVDFFDTMGTVVAVGAQGNMLDKNGKLPGLKNVLLVDSVAAMIGGLFGASSVTTYVESTSGVAQGGRTGLTGVTVAILFLLALFLVPLAYFIPTAAAAPALIIVGYLMMTSVKDIAWDKLEDALPAFLTIVGMVFTFSISKGIGFGFIAYCLIKAFQGKWREVHPVMWLVSIVFALYFLFVSSII